MLLIITARKGSVSFLNVMENWPSRLEKHFEHNSKIMVYPRQHSFNYVSEQYEDITGGPILKGIETIGKGIESIFNLGKNDKDGS